MRAKVPHPYRAPALRVVEVRHDAERRCPIVRSAVRRSIAPRHRLSAAITDALLQCGLTKQGEWEMLATKSRLLALVRAKGITVLPIGTLARIACLAVA